MQIQKGNLVKVEYVGTLDDGQEFDNSSKHGPIEFVVGNHQVIKGFDDAVIGMKVGEEKEFKIPKEQAYGDINPKMIQKLPMDKFPAEIKEKAKAGGFLILSAPNGMQMPVKIVSVDPDGITLDMNHPLAGKDLTFKIKVLEIKEKAEGCGCEECHDCNCDDYDCK